MSQSVCLHNPGHNARVFDLAFSPAGRDLLASGSDDSTAKVWRMRGGASTASTEAAGVDSSADRSPGEASSEGVGAHMQSTFCNVVRESQSPWSWYLTFPGNVKAYNSIKADTSLPSRARVTSKEVGSGCDNAKG